MKRLLHIFMPALMVLLLVVNGFLTYTILYQDFLPESVAAGTEDYAVVQKVSQNWIVSIVDKHGKITDKKYVRSNENSERVKLCYSGESYYFWRYDEKNSKAEVCMIPNEADKEIHDSVTLTVRNGEVILGMNVVDETISAAGVLSHNGNTELTIYTAGITASGFSKKDSYFFNNKFRIRDVLYCKNGSVIILTADGGVYCIKSKDSEPYLLYDGENNPPVSLLTNSSGEIYLWNSDGSVMSLTSGGEAENCLEEMFKKLKTFDEQYSADKCTAISVQSDEFAAVIYESSESEHIMAMYGNGIIATENHISYSSQIKYIFVYILLLAIEAVIVLLIFGIKHIFKDTVTMRLRLKVICITASFTVLTIVTIFIGYIYTKQKSIQKWEGLLIRLNQALEYLNIENQEDLRWLIESISNGYEERNKDRQEFLRKLNSISINDLENQTSCILFVKDENENYISVSGNGSQINRTLEAIYTPLTGKDIKRKISNKYNAISEIFMKNGAYWMIAARKIHISKDNKQTSALLIIQKPGLIYTDSNIFFSIILIYLSVISFVLILLIRIRSLLRPLRSMEIQAKQFIANENCSIVRQKGHNEITLLTWRFNCAVKEIKQSLETSRQSAEAYGRFLPKELLLQMETENLSSLHAGDSIEKEMTILYMRINFPESENKKTERKIYETVFSVLKKNGGIPEQIDLKRMRILFPENCFGAVCTASTVREALQEQCEIRALIDHGRIELRILGDDKHCSICSNMDEEALRLPVLKQMSQEFGCQILITGEVINQIPDFHHIFNSRTIGFFSFGTQNKSMRLIEILTQRTSDAFENAVRLYYAKEYIDAFAYFSDAMKKNPKDSAAVRYLYLCHNALKDSER